MKNRLKLLYPAEAINMPEDNKKEETAQNGTIQEEKPATGSFLAMRLPMLAGTAMVLLLLVALVFIFTPETREKESISQAEVSLVDTGDPRKGIRGFGPIHFGADEKEVTEATGGQPTDNGYVTYEAESMGLPFKVRHAVKNKKASYVTLDSVESDHIHDKESCRKHFYEILGRLEQQYGNPIRKPALTPFPNPEGLAPIPPGKSLDDIRGYKVSADYFFDNGSAIHIGQLFRAPDICRTQVRYIP